MTDDTSETIMRATYETLCAEGYTDLTVQSIADRTDLSKSALFYHYDSKEGLLAAFIDYLLEGFRGRVAATREYPPLDRLAAFLDWYLYGPSDGGVGFHAAMLELRAEAPYNETYRRKLRASDDLLRETLVEILSDGIESGAFRDHEPDAIAAFVLATADGARIRQLSLDRREYLETVRDGIESHVFEGVLAEGQTIPDEAVFVFPRDRRLAGSGAETGEEVAPGTESESDSKTDGGSDSNAGGDESTAEGGEQPG